jgi:hypothetical protein
MMGRERGRKGVVTDAGREHGGASMPRAEKLAGVTHLKPTVHYFSIKSTGRKRRK